MCTYCPLPYPCEFFNNYHLSISPQYIKKPLFFVTIWRGVSTNEKEEKTS